MERAIILGASRGLGAELVKHACSLGYPVAGFGRKAAALAALRERFPLFEFVVNDFSARGGQDETLRYLERENFNKVFYVAGGGPYGLFQERAWKDHLWAFEVSFLFPARVLHLLRLRKPDVQVTVVGSSVAESEPDPSGASYCAAKHALLGLVSSLRRESPAWDLRLFSPGYMDTELLPVNAPARKQGVYSPAKMAEDLWTWSLSSLRADEGGHRVYPKHPS